MKKEELEQGLEMKIDFEKSGDGLVPAVVQDHKSGEILMLAYVNQEALDETFKTGYATFWSRSRQELWTKGKTSGDLLKIIYVIVDCDRDAIVYEVEMLGKGACHTKTIEGETRRSCFYRKADCGKLEFIEGME